jgi:lipoprotein-releasing system permease protein
VNFPLFIARRYLFAKKSRNVINIISTISVVGVSIGTMALIVVLSVYNGFDNLVRSLFNSFDPDIKITLVEGKTFVPGPSMLDSLRAHPGVIHLAEVIEENVLIRYGERQYIATVKGVSEEYVEMSGIDSMIIDGDFILQKGETPYAVIGQGIAIYLSVGLSFITPLNIYVPKRTGRVTLSPENAFNRKYLYPSGVFAIQQDFDSKYMIVPIWFARDLLDYNQEVSALEIKLSGNTDEDLLIMDIQELMGPAFEVKNRLQQQELLYRIMKSEKWAIFFILAFILVVASFNIIGSLTMLIIDKKKDISTLRSLGTDLERIRRIFFIEGWLISFIGAMLGLLIGSLVCWVQQEFGIIQLQGSGSFVINSYPISMEWLDFVFIFLTVLLIGFVAAWYPVRYITRRYLSQNNYIYSAT